LLFTNWWYLIYVFRDCVINGGVDIRRYIEYTDSTGALWTNSCQQSKHPIRVLSFSQHFFLHICGYKTNYSKKQNGIHYIHTKTLKLSS